jgi:hypothetical protein
VATPLPSRTAKSRHQLQLGVDGVDVAHARSLWPRAADGTSPFYEAPRKHANRSRGVTPIAYRNPSRWGVMRKHGFVLSLVLLAVLGLGFLATVNTLSKKSSVPVSAPIIRTPSPPPPQQGRPDQLFRRGLGRLGSVRRASATELATASGDQQSQRSELQVYPTANAA